MIELRPFRALHYNSATIGEAAAVIAPPYDVINDEEHARLMARSPYNVVRLILNREPSPYAAAATTLSVWRAAGVLVQDAEPCLYDYVQDFTLPDGRRYQRAGLMAAVRLQSFAAGDIRPHERTFARAKEDRLRLLEACRTNLSPIFGIYPGRIEPLDALRAARRAAPWLDVTDDRGERHRVWRVHEAGALEAVAGAARHLSVFIADGHHRYETALAYRDQRRAHGGLAENAGANFILMYLAAMDDPGLVILPTHRVLRRLPGDVSEAWLDRLQQYFTVESMSADDAGRDAFLSALRAETAPGVVGICCARPHRLWLLRRRAGAALDEALAGIHPSVARLDVTVLDAVVLRRALGVDGTRAAEDGVLEYTHDDVQAVEAVRSGQAAAAFILRAPRIGDVQTICVAGQTVPEKSTYFYPKLMSGMVLHALDDAGAAAQETARPLTTTV